MKDDVIRIVRNALADADDNLHMAYMSFGHLNTEEMNEQCGQSGSTRAEILAGYHAERDRLQKCVDWVEAV